VASYLPLKRLRELLDVAVRICFDMRFASLSNDIAVLLNSMEKPSAESEETPLECPFIFIHLVV